MNLGRRRFLHLAGGAAALPALSRIARAQSYPIRPVRFVVGFPAGGPNDVLARIIGQWLSERLGQPFVIQNRPGSGTNIATEDVVRAPPDGYTLHLVGPPAAINATLYDNLNFNFIRDVAPIAGFTRVPQVMVVNPSFPAKTVPEFIANVKANPGTINMASGGNGTTGHVAGELFKMMAGVTMVHVPYRRDAEKIADLLSGRVEVNFDLLLGAILCRATRRAVFLALAPPRARPRRSSTYSTRRSMRGSPIHGWNVRQRFRARRGRHGKRPQLPRPDLLDRPLHTVTAATHAPMQSVASKRRRSARTRCGTR